jgi:RNA polymerase subunit RPABC4/transcription elongation factor Spt4
MNIGELSNALGTVLQIVVAVCAGSTLALWLAMVIWTWRDIRARSRDIFAAILAVLLVAVFPVIGLLLYLLLRPKETLAEAYDRALEEEALLRTIEEQVVCPNCQRAVDQGWRFCAYCHTQVKKDCPHCGNLLELGWTICPYCGSPASVPKVHRREELPAQAEPWQLPEPASEAGSSGATKVPVADLPAAE